MDITRNVIILDGDQSIEDRVCRLVRLRDGRRAAVWRGLAYPLLDGDMIDVGGQGVPPGECLPVTAEASPAALRLRWAVVEGLEEVWALIAGSVADRDAAAGRLRHAGLTVLRSGPWLGEPVDGTEADWFVRFARPAAGAALLPLLERILGEREATDLPAGSTAEELRRRLVGAELDRARLEAASLRAEVAQLRLDAAAPLDLTPRLAALQADLERAKAELENALRAPEVQPTAAAVTPPAGPARLARRLQDEIATALENLLPGIRLLRDSLTVASAEFRDRQGFYRALGELLQGAGRLPSAWKKLRGADGWWERHVSTGEDDAGRAYARYGTNGAVWEVLLSHKGEQDRDIAWLRRQR